MKVNINEVFPCGYNILLLDYLVTCLNEKEFYLTIKSEGDKKWYYEWNYKKHRSQFSLLYNKTSSHDGIFTQYFYY